MSMIVTAVLKVDFCRVGKIKQSRGEKIQQIMCSLYWQTPLKNYRPDIIDNNNYLMKISVFAS